MLSSPQNGSWVLFTIAISQNSLYRDSLYQGLSVLYWISCKDRLNPIGGFVVPFLCRVKNNIRKCMAGEI